MIVVTRSKHIERSKEGCAHIKARLPLFISYELRRFFIEQEVCIGKQWI